MNQGTATELFRTVFDALPSLLFVVDQDVKIQEYNAAAAALLGTDPTTIVKRRAGDVLHCLHSTDVGEGCGRGPSCTDCVIRNAVQQAFQGDHIVRQHTRIELIRDQSQTEIFALVSASPFHFQDNPLVLLIIEDISEIVELRRLIPICAICKKVRNDQESWLQLEAYFKENWGVSFSHGLCPECYEKEKAKLDKG